MNTKRIVYAIVALLAFASVRAEAYIVPTVTRRCSGAIEKGAAVKASTTAGRATTLLHTDSAALMTGVTTSACNDAVPNAQVMEVRGVMLQVVSDGTTTIASGDLIQPSTTVNGRFMKGTASPVCSAMQSASAVAGTLFNCIVGVSGGGGVSLSTANTWTKSQNVASVDR